MKAKAKRSLEVEIDTHLAKRWRPLRFGSMTYWKWWGNPGFLSAKATIPKPIDIDVARMVLAASDVECLTSPSEYIRELKKWFNAHKKEDYKILFKSYDKVESKNETKSKRRTS